MGFRVDVTVVGGALPFEPLRLTGFPKLTFSKAIFLMPLQQVGDWLLQCGLLVSTRGSWKVTVLAVFLMPSGEGEVDMASLSTWEVAASLGTLNTMIPSLANVMIHI